MRRLFTVVSFVAGVTLIAVALLAPPAIGITTQERVLRLNVNSSDISSLDPAINHDFYGTRRRSQSPST